MAITVRTITTFPLDGSTREFNINFDYLARKFVQVSIVGTNVRKELVLGTDYRFATATSIRTTEALLGEYDRIEIRRVTSTTERVVNFADGSILRATDLNAAQVQAIHIAEEARDAAILSISQDDSGNLDAKGRRIINLAPGINGTDAINKAQLDTTLGEAGGILSEVKDEHQQIIDYIDNFVNNTANLKNVLWVYNNGAAVGGETGFNITKEGDVLAVPAIFVNGNRQDRGYHFEYDRATKRVILAKSLKPGDFVICVTAEGSTPLADILSTAGGGRMIGMPQGGTLAQAVTRRTILSFGAVGDGVTDDTAAFKAAYAASDVQIVIPSGYTFLVSDLIGSLTVSKRKMWVGEPGARIITKGSGGFAATGLGWSFQNIRFIPLPLAPLMTVPFAIKSGVVDSNRGSSITDCEFRAETSGYRYDVAIDLYNVWYSKFENLYINQSGQADFSKQVYGGIGIRFNYCVNNNLTNSQIGSCGSGVVVSAAISPSNLGTPHCSEGLIIEKNTMIANLMNLEVREGYFIKVSSNVIDIPLASTTNPVYFAAMASQLTDNWIATSVGSIYIGRGESGLGSYDGSGNIIARNTIRGSSSSTTDSVVVGAGVGLLMFVGNHITFGGYGLRANGGGNWFVDGNTFAAQKTGAYDLHLVSMARIGINKVYSPTTPVKAVDASAVLTPTTFCAAVTVSLIGTPLSDGKATTASQNFNVPVPAGYFVAVPEVATASLNTGTILGIARYVRGESTATNLKFAFVGVGADIPAGNFSFSVIAMDKASSF